MNDSLIARLICPVCASSVEKTADGKSIKCLGPKTHCFDFSKEGYLNLNTGLGIGDDKDMIRSRTAFLDAGYYAPISDAVNRALLASVGKDATVLDAGCGEGYYSCRMAQCGVNVLGLDLSKEGIRHAAMRAKREGLGNTGFLVGSIFDLPIASESMDAAVSIFAPIAETEFSRVLKSGGYLVTVSAGENHLMGLKKVLYEQTYQNGTRSDFPTRLSLVSEERVTETVTVRGRELIEALFSMTPYYWRTAAEDKQKLRDIDELETPIDMVIRTYRKET